VEGRAEAAARQARGKQEWSKKSGAISHRKEREDTDLRKLIIKPLAKLCKGQACSERMMWQLNDQGVGGVEFVAA